MSNRMTIAAIAAGHGWDQVPTECGGKTITYGRGESRLHVQFSHDGRIWWLALDRDCVVRDRMARALAFLAA